VSFVRNRLAALAGSEWIHFHDVDDLISPDYLSRLSPFLRDGVDVVSCDADWIGEEDRKLIMAWRYDPRALQQTPLPYLLQTPMSLNNTIIRRSAWLRVGGCDERLKMWEDADVHFRLARAGYRFLHVPEVLTWSLRRQSSFSHDYRASWRNRLRALEGYAEQDSAGLQKDDLAEAAEAAALALAHLEDKEATGRAIDLARRLGRNPPSSGHPGARLLKRILPAYTLMRWQARRRNRSA
jgi:GT2 family glycosyltransferase